MKQQKKNKKHIQISLAIIMLLCFAVLIFVAGTSVATPGGVAAIESLRVGDKVATRNATTGLVEYQPVKHVYVYSSDELTQLTLDNGETITTTPNHPFYVQNNGYINAADLRAGDILVTVNGDKVIVEQISHEILESPVLVYNLEVGDNHNYFVGDDDSVLVHNKCGGYENGFSKPVGDVKQYKNVRVDYQPKNAKPVHVQWDSPKMPQHSYPWDNDMEIFVGLGRKHPINADESLKKIAKKIFEIYVGE